MVDPSRYFAYKFWSKFPVGTLPPALGDMKKTTYDPDADGKIANSELVSGESITLTIPSAGQKKILNCYVENGLLIIVSDE